MCPTLQFFGADCEARALAIHCCSRPSGVLWQRRGVNSCFLATLQFGWPYCCFLKFLPHPTSQVWLCADSYNHLLLLVMDWPVFHPGAPCIVLFQWSQAVSLWKSMFARWVFLPVSFQPMKVRLSQKVAEQGGHMQLQSCCALKGFSSFSVPLAAVSPVTIGTNCLCPSNQRNVKLARGPKYISWQQDKSKSTEKFMQREYF